MDTKRYSCTFETNQGSGYQQETSYLRNKPGVQTGESYELECLFTLLGVSALSSRNSFIDVLPSGRFLCKHQRRWFVIQRLYRVKVVFLQGNDDGGVQLTRYRNSYVRGKETERMC